MSKHVTPEAKGVQPCRHCSSRKHWDNECKHARKGMKYARANLAMADSDMERAQDAYDKCYYNLSSSDSKDKAPPAPQVLAHAQLI